MTMGLTRFEELADAWGGDLNRWPQPEQAAARAMLAAEPRAAMVLAEAARLDALLALDAAPEPSEILERRVIRAAPSARRLGFGWASRAGWAAAAAAGLVCGVLISEQALTGLRAETSYEQAQAWSLDEGDYFG